MEQYRRERGRGRTVVPQRTRTSQGHRPTPLAIILAMIGVATLAGIAFHVWLNTPLVSVSRPVVLDPAGETPTTTPPVREGDVLPEEGGTKTPAPPVATT
ncbi:MAG: hypothetical protein KBD21_03825, partial [Candidatus Pacebacteria bacterium]|nr:hypothetical protein [Candidatus Paceibacterota bacterium]